MPGRPSLRARAAERAAAKKAAPVVGSSTIMSTASTVLATPRSRSAANANTVDIPDEGAPTALREQVCRIFAEAQRGVLTQRKSAITLRKIQELCCYDAPSTGKQKQHAFAADAAEFDEGDFNTEMARCVLRVMGVKRGEPVGDRLIKFVGLFLKLAADKDYTIFAPEGAAEEDAVPETPTARLTSHLLKLALQLATAKDKVVRYRATQLIAHIVNTLDSIDDELFQLVRLALLKRLRDKENNIRVQAVLGLGRLANESSGDNDDNDDSDDDDGDDTGRVLEKLLDVLQHDPSADVRRALLLNLPFTPKTLPYLLERARDLDAATRRALYSRLLPALGDFRHLSLTHREKLLRWGLRDRDENVRRATARLFRERWIEDCVASHTTANADPAEAEVSAGAVLPQSNVNMDALQELLERIDIVNSGVDTGIAHEAMKQFWDGRPDYREQVSFDDPYFDNLSAESVFVARSFNQFCKESGNAKLESLREDKMPEVTKFAFFLQSHTARLVRGVELVALNPDDADIEEDTVQQEFCLEQLLHIAKSLDYSDEMGRRKMFSIMRETLALAELPEECTKLVVEVLRIVCGSNTASEQEFCSIVLEAIAEVHDTIMGDEQQQNQPGQEQDNLDDDASEADSFHSAQSNVSSVTAKPSRSPSVQPEGDEDKAVREIMVNMKCLHIAQCMLQNVQCDLENNSHLVTMLNNLVVPAVRSQEAPLRERGLVCLGLCCLLSSNLAQENLGLFLHCFNKGHEALQVIAVQIVADMLTCHPSLLLPPRSENTDPTNKKTSDVAKLIAKLFSKSLRLPDKAVQTNGCIALSKLLLMGTLAPNDSDTEQQLQQHSGGAASDLLKQMTLAYFAPDKASHANASLRQALTYFLPVYAHSRRRNAIALARIAVPLIAALAELRDDELGEHLLEDNDDDYDGSDDDDAAAVAANRTGSSNSNLVGNSAIVAQLCDWTDPRKLVPVFVRRSDDGAETELDGHLVLAELVLERMLTTGCTKEERKNLAPILGKIVILPSAPLDTLQALADLTATALGSRMASETAIRNALNKLSTAVAKVLLLQKQTADSATTIAGAGDSTTARSSIAASARVIDTTESHADASTATAVSSSLPPHGQQKAVAGDGDDVELDSDSDAADFTMLTRPDREGTIFADEDMDEDDATE